MFHPPVLPRTPEGTRESPRADVKSLELELERLLMITEALWEILKEKHGYTDDELVRRIALIDLKDGTLDGRVAKSAPAQCPKCGRVLGKRHVTCLYCGTQLVQDPFVR
jgi:hypothetical protein